MWLASKVYKLTLWQCSSYYCFPLAFVGPRGLTHATTLTALAALKGTRWSIVNLFRENAVQGFSVNLPASLVELVTKQERLFLLTPATHVKVNGKCVLCLMYVGWNRIGTDAGMVAVGLAEGLNGVTHNSSQRISLQMDKAELVAIFESDCI